MGGGGGINSSGGVSVALLKTPRPLVAFKHALLPVALLSFSMVPYGIKGTLMVENIWPFDSITTSKP